MQTKTRKHGTVSPARSGLIAPPQPRQNQRGPHSNTKTITGTFQTVKPDRSWNALDPTPAGPVPATAPPIARPATTDLCAPCANPNTFETALAGACRVATTPI